MFTMTAYLMLGSDSGVPQPLPLAFVLTAEYSCLFTSDTAVEEHADRERTRNLRGRMCLSSAREVAVLRPNLMQEASLCRASVSFHDQEENGAFRQVYGEVLKELQGHFEEMQRISTESNLAGSNDEDCLSPNFTEKEETVFLVDWDDTVMATTFLSEEEARKGYLTLSSYARFKFLELDRLVVSVLRKASTFGRVVVVTNAGEGWVQVSASRYMPMVSALLEEGNIKVVSARSSYFEQFPEAPLEWKVHAFHDELREQGFEQGKLNLIVIGDSLSDQYAAHEVVSRLRSTADTDTMLKFVKLIDRPSLDQLKKQMSLVLLNVERMVKYQQAFDICVST